MKYLHLAFFLILGFQNLFGQLSELEIEWGETSFNLTQVPNFLVYKDSVHTMRIIPLSYAEYGKESTVYFYRSEGDVSFSVDSLRLLLCSYGLLYTGSQASILLEQFDGILKGDRNFYRVPLEPERLPVESDKQKIYSYETGASDAPLDFVESANYFVLYRYPIDTYITKKELPPIKSFRKSDGTLLYAIELKLPSKHELIDLNNIFQSANGDIYLSYRQHISGAYSGDKPDDIIIQKISIDGQVSTLYHTLEKSEFINNISFSDHNGKVSIDVAVRHLKDQNDYLKFITYSCNDDFTELSETSRGTISFKEHFDYAGEEMFTKLQSLADREKFHVLFRQMRYIGRTLELGDGSEITLYSTQTHNRKYQGLTTGFYVVKKSKEATIEWARYMPFECSFPAGALEASDIFAFVDEKDNLKIILNDLRTFYDKSGRFKEMWSLFEEKELFFYKTGRAPAIWTIDSSGKLLSKELIDGFEENEFMMPGLCLILNDNEICTVRAESGKAPLGIFIADNYRLGIGTIK